MADPEGTPATEAQAPTENNNAVDEVEEVDETPEQTARTTGKMITQVMKDPTVLAAMQHTLSNLVGTPSGYIESLPKPVKRRIKALKKLQFEATKVEAEFYKEVHKLECAFSAKYAPMYEKRKEIVNQLREPTDEECDWQSDTEKEDEDEKEEKDEVKNKVKVDGAGEGEKTEGDEKEKEEDMKGIPEFWLTIFKNVDMLSEMIQDVDEPILKHLQDVKVNFTESDPMGFTLEFHFTANDYFTNTVLTKQYTMKSEPDESDPFSFEGPEIIKCDGCKIDWKKGKNITVKTVKKKQKHKGSGTTRTVTKTVQNDSFFNFFSPPVPPEDESEMDEDTEALLAADFEIGHFIRERIVPRAVLYFTGEALENDDDLDEEEGEEEGGEEADEDDDPDYSPQVTIGYKPGKGQYLIYSRPSTAPLDTLLRLPNKKENTTNPPIKKKTPRP